MAKSSRKEHGPRARSEGTLPEEEPPSDHFWRRSLTGTFGQSGLGMLLLWAAMPPLGWWPLAFLAPVSWIVLIRWNSLPGKRPYRAIWLAGFLFWFATLHWMRMPHPATSLGWLAASAYLGLYLPCFVGLSRLAVHRLGVSAVFAAPVVWMGLELVRGHIVGGFTMASLGHPLHHWPVLIQTADLAGSYGVSFLVMFVAACLGRTLPVEDSPRRIVWPVAAGLLLTGAALAYGYVRMGQAPTEMAVRIALIQGSTDITLRPDPDRAKRMHREHLDLSFKTQSGTKIVDLIVWPESVFQGYLLTYDKDVMPSAEWTGTDEEFHQRLQQESVASQQRVVQVAQSLGVPVLVGITRYHVGRQGEAIYNSAAYALPTGEFVGWYDKIHLVMFGEYFPFADQLSFLYDFTPVNTLGLGLQAGDEPVAFDLHGLSLAPNICYESVVPQVFHRQVNDLAAAGSEPDVLVNLTNDGWFFGSNELDLHMICGVFRAVECRKPFLIAANTGISAWIDGNGRIRDRGPRRAPAVIYADVAVDERKSLYLQWGDLPAGLCLLCCAALVLIGLKDRWQRRTGR